MAAPALDAQPVWVGVLLIAGSLLPLLAGWRLIRWTTMLVSAGVVLGAVLFWSEPYLGRGLAWLAALACSVLAGALGWFLYPAIAAVQACALAASLTIGGLLALLPGWPALAYGLGCGVGAVAGLIGWRLAGLAAIVQTILVGYAGVLMGMLVLCRPASPGTGLLLALVVALITIPAGAWTQGRAWRRERTP
jgi:hypothetical protein